MFKIKMYLILAVMTLVPLMSSACSQDTQGIWPAATPAEAANFQFLVSDEENDINDFKNLFVTVSSIGIQQGGESSGWTQFTPDIDRVDLKPLNGKNAQEIWNGNIPAGEYKKVFIYISEVEGILMDGSIAEVKLPGNKLQISKSFIVSDVSTTTFVFDITVIKAGESGKYILKPQITESGADQEFTEIKHNGKKEKEQKQDQKGEKLQLRLEGDIKPGGDVLLVVKQRGKPVGGAVVLLNGQEIGATDSEGKKSITIPQDAEKVEVKATSGNVSGEIELEFENGELEAETAGAIQNSGGQNPPESYRGDNKFRRDKSAVAQRNDFAGKGGGNGKYTKGADSPGNLKKGGRDHFTAQ
ncbi:MAG: DUF4382 domain-containing protein [Dehalococcoidia bacterium]|nr:DUF4382 domain-containing protein [Dehalococcoidia bacterium]